VTAAEQLLTGQAGTLISLPTFDYIARIASCKANLSTEGSNYLRRKRSKVSSRLFLLPLLLFGFQYGGPSYQLCDQLSIEPVGSR